MEHERPSLEVDLIPPSKKQKTALVFESVVSSDDLFSDKSFFCAQIAPFLGLATKLVMRLVAQRFGTWLCQVWPRPKQGDVLRDMARNKLGRYFCSLVHGAKSAWASGNLASCTRWKDTFQREHFVHLAEFTKSIIDATEKYTIVYNALDELFTLTTVEGYAKILEGALIAEHLPYASFVLACVGKRGDLPLLRAAFPSILSTPSLILKSRGRFFSALTGYITSFVEITAVWLRVLVSCLLLSNNRIGGEVPIEYAETCYESIICYAARGDTTKISIPQFVSIVGLASTLSDKRWRRFENPWLGDLARCVDRQGQKPLWTAYENWPELTELEYRRIEAVAKKMFPDEPFPPRYVPLKDRPPKSVDDIEGLTVALLEKY